MKIDKLEQKDIKSLIGDQNSFYSIPDYQRPYSWEEDQISDFWQDISKSFENENGSYFLGSFILIKQKEAGRYEIVDGQQRLTTITIFLAVLRDYFYENGQDILAQKVQDEFLVKDSQPRLFVRDIDKLKFNEVVLGKIGSLTECKSFKLNPCYVNAIKNLQQYIEDKKQEGVGPDYFEKLYYYFLSEVFAIVVVTDDITSAYTIFETINNRGKELLVQDLLKNYLLKKVQDEVVSYNKNCEGLIRDFESEKKTFVANWQQIEGKKHDLSDMLNYHYSVVGGANKRHELFKEITDYIRDKNRSVNDFMLEWEKTVEVYDSLQQRNGLSDGAYKNLLSLRQIKNSYWISILISARLLGMSDADFEELIFEVEKMFALYWISGYNSVKIKYPSWTLIRDYINKKKDISEIKKFIKSNLSENRVNRKFSEAINDECYGKSWCRYILAKYELTLSDETMTKEFNFDKIQIEHILPQTMNDIYWTSRFTEEQHDKLVNTLGNLTLLAGGIKEKNKSKNQSASNKPYPDKLKIYTGETLKDGISALNMTRELDKYKDWVVDSIVDRKQLIIDKLMEVWKVSEDEIKNEEVVVTDHSNENEFTQEELIQIDNYKLFLETKYKIKFINRSDNEDAVIGSVMTRKRCTEQNYYFLGSEFYGEDEYADDWYLPLIGFAKSSVDIGEIILFTQIMNDEEYLSVIEYLHNKTEFNNWRYYNDDRNWMFIKIELSNSELINVELSKIYEALLDLKNNHQASEFFEDNRGEVRALEIGNYSDDELKERLLDSLDRETPLTPRFKVFIKTLLSAPRSFTREEIKEALSESGVSDDVGSAGRNLSNISQFITKEGNDHLRQIIEFDAENEGAGASKDNYRIVDKYRELVKSIM